MARSEVPGQRPGPPGMKCGEIHGPGFEMTPGSRVECEESQGETTWAVRTQGETDVVRGNATTGD